VEAPFPFDRLPAELADSLLVRAIDKPWECMRCRRRPKRLHIFSAERQWDRMHTAKFSQPGFKIGEGLLLLCHECRAQWLIWQARMGFDLHSHAATTPCDHECFSARQGRAAQYSALQGALMDTKVGFFMGKAIDGMPKKNGLTGLTCARTAYFCGGPVHRQRYYESVRSPLDLAHSLERASQLRSVGVPLHMVDHHMIIVKVYESAYDAPRGVLKLPSVGDLFVDLHCVSLHEYNPTTATFRFKNNWGEYWGDRGFGTMSMEYASEQFHEGWIFRPGRWGPVAAKQAMLAAPDIDRVRLRQVWSIENQREVRRLPGLGAGRNARWQWYESISPMLGRPIVGVEVRNGFGLRMAWAFVRDASEEVAEITELFVWPTFRRAYLGSWLEGACHFQAAEWGKKELHLILNESDSVVGPIRHAARHFADTLDYSARWRTREAPRAHTTFVKLVRV
jgi:hypothetical protein